MKHDLKKIGEKFDIPGDFIFGEPYGTGHINDTYAVTYDQAGIMVRYIFQRINHNVFKNPEKLMDNIYRVTRHIRKKLKPFRHSSRRGLKLIKSLDGSLPYARDEEGNYWRVYIFIEQAKTYDVIENANQCFNAAKAFGDFQRMLVDLPGERLFETIPDFHNTPKRYQDFLAAVKADPLGRAKSAQREIDFVMAREADTGLLIKLHQSGDIPERITHNDTKLNNVMLDYETGEGICVIDLDTVMPGLAHYDFGDMVRTGTSPAAEDEMNLDNVFMRFEMFEALLRGYLSSAGEFLNECEKEHLVFAGKLISLEIGMRFLADHLVGDTYFKIHRDNHNLDRSRTQFKLVESIEAQSDKMKNLLKEL